MANRTDKEAASIHGTNPQNLVEKIVRLKIYETIYWKESCFALTAESLIDKAVELKCVGGTHGGARAPCNFMCLILKMLQIQPDKEIIIEYIKNEDFKYVRLLGAFYMRLVGRPLEVYQYLEPLYNDYRKIRVQLSDGNYALVHMDEVVDDLLRKDYLFDIALPRIPNRLTLEKTGQLDPRLSVLDEEFDEAVLELEAGEAAKQAEAAAEAAEREQQQGKAAARAGRDDEGRHESEKARERPREKWREDPKDRRKDDRDRDRGKDDDYDRDRSRRDRDGYEDRDKDRVRSRHDERDKYSSRDEDRDRRRGRSRSASPDRDRRRRERSQERDRARPREEYKGSGASKSKAVDLNDPEVVAANAERAKLGLKPLR